MIQSAVEGLAYSGLYALLGLGFYLTYGVLRRIDLAYGTVIMTSVYVGTMIAAGLGMPWYMVLLLSLAIGVPLSLVIAYVAFVLVRGDARFSMAATLGVWMALEELILQSPGRGRGQPVANPFENDTLSIVGATLRVDHILALAIAVGLVWSVRSLLTNTRQGLAIRVSVYDRDAASLLGVSRLAALASATAIAAGVGIVAGWAFAVSQSGIDMHFGMWATMKGLVILVLAGADRIGSVLAAAVVLGISERLGTEFAGVGYRDLIGYGLMLVLLGAAALKERPEAAR